MYGGLDPCSNITRMLSGRATTHEAALQVDPPARAVAHDIVRGVVVARDGLKVRPEDCLVSTPVSWMWFLVRAPP